MESYGPGMHVVTLGTAAGPAIRSERQGIATAIVIDEKFYLVDFGLGVTRAAAEAGLPGAKIAAAFITHLHSDHVAELPAYLLWNWGSAVNGFIDQLPIIGPGNDPAGPPSSGTSNLISRTLDAFAYDIAIRTSDESRTDLRKLVEGINVTLPDEIARRASGDVTPDMEPLVVFEDDRVTVTAILVEHPPVFPAFAFRFTSSYGSVVVSGDTAECRNMTRLAEGADVLVHESVYLPFYAAKNFDNAFLLHQQRAHTTPEGAGRIAKAANVQTLILSHLAGVASEAEWISGAKATFDGETIVAHDGQVFTVHPAADRPR